MTRIATSLVLLALVACSRGGAPAYRDAARPIGSMAAFEPSRLEGTWVEVAGFGPGCTRQGVLVFSEGGRRLEGISCRLPLRGAGTLAASGPGRLRLNGVEVWVLWVDADYRTLVLGTPAGSFGAVLNRGGPIPGDRLMAARRILAFNGYDAAALVVP